MGAAHISFPPNDFDALRAAGVMHATSIMALAEDDRLNLQVSLKARDLNPKIRVVLRQFNRTLGRKIEQNLPDCSVLSLSAHSAATFAAAAVDRNCFYGLQFPDMDGPLVGFSERAASEFGVGSLTVADAERKVAARIVGINGEATFLRGRELQPADRIVVFGRMSRLEASRRHEARPVETRSPLQRTLRTGARLGRSWKRADPIFKSVVFAAVALFIAATVFFSFELHKDGMTAAYFVATTMSTVGYGDITPLGAGPLPMLFSMLLMAAGVGLSGIIIAFATSALTRAQWISLQGLRRIRAREHVIVCGAGNVGLGVIEYLLSLGKRLVVIDGSPDPAIIEASRNRSFDLLTGDATRDSTLDLCNLEEAIGVVALTESDTANLEVALGARARNPDISVVMRVQDGTFAKSVARQFGLTLTFSTASLAAPAFAGLSRFPGTRGRIEYGDEDYTVGERLQGEVPAPPPANNCIPLCVWRNGEFLHIDDFDQMQPYDRLLFLVPLSQFRSTPRRRVVDADMVREATAT